MLDLALRTVRPRVPSLVAVGVAAVGGSALLTVVGVLAESGTADGGAVERLTGADAVVAAEPTRAVEPTGDAVDDAFADLVAVPLPERPAVDPAAFGGLDALADVPGAGAVVPDVSFAAALVTPDGAVVTGDDPATTGHGWASTVLLPPGAVDGEEPGPTGVAVGSDLAASAGVGVGDTVEVVLAGERAERTVSALVDGVDGVWVDDASARTAADRGIAGPDLVAVVAEEGTHGSADVAALAATVTDVVGDGHVVATGAARGNLERPDLAEGRALLPVLTGSLAGIVVLVVGAAVAGALGVAVQTQRRELALLRAVGATPRQVRRLAALQAGLVAAPAAFLGVPLGYLGAGALRDLLVTVGLLPDGVALRFGPLPALAAVALVLLTVHLAATLAASRMSRLPATEAVAESRTEPRTPSSTRTLVGVLLVVLGTAAAVAPLATPSELGAAGTASAGLVIAVGLAVLGPRLTGWVADVAARVLPRRASVPAWLAVENARVYATRTGTAVSTFALVVVFVLTYALTHTTLHRAAADDAAATGLADVTVAAPGLAGVPDGVAEQVADVPGVRAVVPVATTGVLLETTVLGSAEVEAVDALVVPAGADEVLDLALVEGSLTEVTGDAVVLSEAAARGQGVGAGDRVDLVLGDGTEVSADVAAVHGRGTGTPAVLLSTDLVDGHRASPLPTQLLVRTDGDPATAERVGAVTAAHPGAVTASPEPGTGAGVARELWVNVAILGVTLAYLLLGVTNSLVASTTRRRAEVATLRLAGATPRQVLALVRREATLVTAIAVGAGVLLSVVPLALLGMAFLDRPLAAGPWWLLPVLVTVVAAVAFAATEVPARRLLRDTAIVGARTE